MASATLRWLMEDSATVYKPVHVPVQRILHREDIHHNDSPVDKSDFVMLYHMIGGLALLHQASRCSTTLKPRNQPRLVLFYLPRARSTRQAPPYGALEPARDRVPENTHTLRRGNLTIRIYAAWRLLSRCAGHRLPSGTTSDLCTRLKRSARTTSRSGQSSARYAARRWMGIRLIALEGAVYAPQRRTTASPVRKAGMKICSSLCSVII